MISITIINLFCIVLKKVKCEYKFQQVLSDENEYKCILNNFLNFTFFYPKIDEKVKLNVQFKVSSLKIKMRLKTIVLDKIKIQHN